MTISNVKEVKKNKKNFVSFSNGCKLFIGSHLYHFLQMAAGLRNNELLRTKVCGTCVQFWAHVDFLWLWRVGDSAFNGAVKQESET